MDGLPFGVWLAIKLMTLACGMLYIVYVIRRLHDQGKTLSGSVKEAFSGSTVYSKGQRIQMIVAICMATIGLVLAVTGFVIAGLYYSGVLS